MDGIYFMDGTNGDIELYINGNGIEQLEDSHGCMVIPIYRGNYVMTYHPKRKGWEFPAGKREEDENPIQCAMRETYEETGAILTNIKPLGYYNVSIDDVKYKTAIFVADVEEFQPKPRWSETDLVKLFDVLPKGISYTDNVYKRIIEHIEKNK